VRPGWFDYNAPTEHRLVLLQGDKRHAGDPSDGVIARRQIAEILVRSLTSPQADRKRVRDDLEQLRRQYESRTEGTRDLRSPRIASSASGDRPRRSH
jgi:hypothetical protein